MQPQVVLLIMMNLLAGFVLSYVKPGCLVVVFGFS